MQKIKKDTTTLIEQAAEHIVMIDLDDEGDLSKLHDFLTEITKALGSVTDDGDDESFVERDRDSKMDVLSHYDLPG